MRMLGRRVIEFTALLLLGLLVLIAGLWGTMALWYFDHANAALRAVLAATFGLVLLGTLVALGWRLWRWRVLAVFVAAFALLLLCWSALTPTNDRDWTPEVAVLPYA